MRVSPEMLQGRCSYEFTSLVRELEPASELMGSKSYWCQFTGVEKPFESCDGLSVQLRYRVRVTILRQYSNRIVHEETLRVHVDPAEPEATTDQMEVVLKTARTLSSSTTSRSTT